MKTAYGFSRRGPDRVAEELATVLSKKGAYEFKALFTIVHANLRSRNAASGGEEMLRLRAYEKLQNLVQAGIVKKTGKEYRGVSAALVTFLATAAELNAKFEAGTHVRLPVSAMAVVAPVVVVVAKAVPVKAVPAKTASSKVATKAAPAKAAPTKASPRKPRPRAALA